MPETLLPVERTPLEKELWALLDARRKGISAGRPHDLISDIEGRIQCLLENSTEPAIAIGRVQLAFTVQPLPTLGTVMSPKWVRETPATQGIVQTVALPEAAGHTFYHCRAVLAPLPPFVAAVGEWIGPGITRDTVTDETGAVCLVTTADERIQCLRTGIQTGRWAIIIEPQKAGLRVQLLQTPEEEFTGALTFTRAAGKLHTVRHVTDTAQLKLLHTLNVYGYTLQLRTLIWQLGSLFDSDNELRAVIVKGLEAITFCRTHGLVPHLTQHFPDSKLMLESKLIALAQLQYKAIGNGATLSYVCRAALATAIENEEHRTRTLYQQREETVRDMAAGLQKRMQKR